MISIAPNRRRRFAALSLALAMLLTTPAFAAPPSDGDINRLLAASRAQTMLDSMLPQMEAMQRQQFAQMASQHSLTPEQTAQMQKIEQRTSQTLRQALAWSQLRPMYVDLYKQSFSKDDILAMAEFYESSAGQSLLDKTPALMQNLMQAIQQRMQPMLADLQKDLDQIVSEGEPAADKN